VQGYAEQVELSHIKSHDFRRFVGTQLATSDIRKAQKALEHKRIDTTARHYVLDELEAGLTAGWRCPSAQQTFFHKVAIYPCGDHLSLSTKCLTAHRMPAYRQPAS